VEMETNQVNLEPYQAQLPPDFWIEETTPHTNYTIFTKNTTYSKTCDPICYVQYLAGGYWRAECWRAGCWRVGCWKLSSEPWEEGYGTWETAGEFNNLHTSLQFAVMSVLLGRCEYIPLEI
jgi:hypothetical protein